MGSWVNCKISGASADSSTSWGHWIKQANATAMTYKFNGTAVADALAAAPPLSVPATPKFGVTATGLTGITWTGLALSSTGPKGSTAFANTGGSSSVGLLGWGCDMSASALTNAAAAGGAATASADGSDPWEVPIKHTRGQRSFVMITLTPDISLEPATGRPKNVGVSGVRLYGSFGKISLSLDGSTNKPKFKVTLEQGWKVYKDIQLPTIGTSFPEPKNPLSETDLEHLFLSQHDPAVPVWQWKHQPPAFTFVKEVPRSVSSEIIEASIGVDDSDADDEQDDADEGVQ